MTRWRIKGWKNGTLISYGFCETLDDALDCVMMLGKGTHRKFRIYKIEEQFYDDYTAKKVERIRAGEVEE